MRNPQKVAKFVQKWKGARPGTKVIWEYRDICQNLMFNDEELIVRATNIMRSNMMEWAACNSQAYENSKPFYTKSDLEDKDSWFVRDLLGQSARMKSSGSTTGKGFEYLRWDPMLIFIECDNHYDMIMDEFEIPSSPSILNCFSTPMSRDGEHVTVSGDSQNFMDHHGARRRACVHYLNLEMQRRDEPGNFSALFDHLGKNRIDVMFSNGPQINKLCSAIKSQKYQGKVCDLLSNTNEMMLREDADFLLSGGFVKRTCDHMRCWDGGAMFFTCRYGTYHLMDNMSWCLSVGEKLVCTDYLNPVCPFVNYWNGDYCSIEERYVRCGCGRMYRPFKFLENRPFAIKGKSVEEYKRRMIEAGITNLKQVRCNRNVIEIVSREDLTQQSKEKIALILDKLKLAFVVEPHGQL